MKFRSLTPNVMVEDVNETVEYYKDKLGFELIMSVPEEG
ncbi:bleomycin resistance family protein, partial [candidate division KSB1 bacterium]|nr:bleomycin resistance family protein [candidate division KSB1 bacterium]NIR70462.1 bleomycin resistance family protein [candidate division KSB1 bacterium]NIS23192.1 bleomycin resistance family protein [candidate division KSB1 bacterium]NIU23689.1 bleomycin resistance family protein [candidate division KSB1 bacterium]NIU91448.1 bleomycin resistance family protein [candidate division KSB1 bacterium]